MERPVPDWCLRGARLLLVTLALGALSARASGQETAPQPDPVDSDGVTVIGTHDDPPTLDHFDLPTTSAPNYQWSKLGAYGLENSSSNSYFVPNGTATEFQAFLDHPPAGATAAPACWSAVLSGACAGSTLPAGLTASVPCGDFACASGQWRRESVRYAIIIYPQTFVAPVTGTYRVLAVGGGLNGAHSPGYVTGRGGSSGYVAYASVDLVAGQPVSVNIGGNSGSSAAGTTSFGAFVAAPGGTVSSLQDPGQTGGGSGGGSQGGGAGGSCGSNGGGAVCSGCTTELRGLGQGSSFSAHFGEFTRVALSCGSGAPPGYYGSGGALGGGGAGGVVVNGVVVGGHPNGAGDLRGGFGYGAGGGGGQTTGAYSNHSGGPGVGGVVVVEW